MAIEFLWLLLGLALLMVGGEIVVRGATGLARDLAGDHHAGDQDRPHDRGAADDQPDVGHVRAEDVAERELAASVPGGNQIHRELRRAGAEGDHGQTDHQRRDTQIPRQTGRAAHDGLATHREERQPEKEPQELDGHASGILARRDGPRSRKGAAQDALRQWP